MDYENQLDIIDLIKSSKSLYTAFYELIYDKLLSDGYVSIANVLVKQKSFYIQNSEVDTRIKSALRNSDQFLRYLLPLEQAQLLSKFRNESRELNRDSQLALLMLFYKFYGEDLWDFLRIVYTELRTEFSVLYGEKYPDNIESPLNMGFEDFALECKQGYLFSNKVKLYFINGFDDFIYQLNCVIKLLEADLSDVPNRKQSLKLFYRGHSDVNYKLIPSIQRSKELMENEHLLCEESLLRNPDFFKNARFNIDKLTLMQHYGLPTRLLDITSNPLVALYFTVCSSADKDGELIIFGVQENLIKYRESDSISILASLAFLDFNVKDNLFDNIIPRVEKQSDYNSLLSRINLEKPYFENRIDGKIFEENYFTIPYKDNRRIQKQDGAFICCSCNPYVSDNLNQYRFSRSDKRWILIIPKNIKQEIKKQLEVFDIHSGTIYPEIDKVSEYLVEKYS